MALHHSASCATRDPGLSPGSVTAGRDRETNEAAHNWPSVVRVSVHAVFTCGHWHVKLSQMPISPSLCRSLWFSHSKTKKCYISKMCVVHSVHWYTVQFVYFPTCVCMSSYIHSKWSSVKSTLGQCLHRSTLFSLKSTLGQCLYSSTLFIFKLTLCSVLTLLHFVSVR